LKVLQVDNINLDESHRLGSNRLQPCWGRIWTASSLLAISVLLQLASAISNRSGLRDLDVEFSRRNREVDVWVMQPAWNGKKLNHLYFVTAHFTSVQ
jgi:hypothetical protein